VSKGSVRKCRVVIKKVGSLGDTLTLSSPKAERQSIHGFARDHASVIGSEQTFVLIDEMSYKDMESELEQLRRRT
jgi:hypothetical protein